MFGRETAAGRETVAGKGTASRIQESRAGPDLRLAPAAVSAWAVTWWASAERARTVLIAAAVVVASLGLLLGLLLFAGKRTHRVAWVAAATLLAAVVAAVLMVTGVRLLSRENDPLTKAAAAHADVAFVGKVVGDPHQLKTMSAFGGSRWAVRVAVRQLTLRGRTVRSTGQVVAFGNPRWSGLVAGSHVRARGRLGPGRLGDAESAVVFPRGSPVVIDQGGWLWRSAERLRVGLRKACDGLPSDARGLLPALVVGDTSRLSQRLRDDLQSSGLTHLTAVSGANVAIVAATSVAVIGGIGAGRRVQVAGTALAIVGFVVLARPEPSVLRAAVMGGLALVGLLWARPGAGVPILAATTVLLMVADPWLARSYGFVLSALATAGLLLLVPAWLQRSRRWPRSVVIALAVPLAAQLTTAPVTVLLNPVVSLVAVPANLLADAAVGPATVAGVVAAGLSPVWPAGAHLVALGGGWATEWIAIVAHRAAALPGAALPWPEGLRGALLLAALSVGAVVLSLRRAWFVLGLSLVGVGFFLTAPRWVALLPVAGGWPPPDWVVAQCDVGQGSSTLIRSGVDHAVIVDTGPDPSLVDACLHRAGVKVLDLVVITHFHADHAGGLAGALRGRGRPPIVVSPLPEPADQFRHVVALAAGIGRRPVVGQAWMVGQAGTGSWAVHWRLLPPPRAAYPGQLRSPASSGYSGGPRYPAGTANSGGPTLSGRGSPEGMDGTMINNSSLVVFAEVHGLRVMALGDVEPEAQRPLIRTILSDSAAGVRMAPVDVVIVAHHGSARQEPRLYQLLRPRIAMIGVGAGNDYGHPAPFALKLLRQVGALTLRTDTQGQLAVSGTADRLRATTSR